MKILHICAGIEISNQSGVPNYVRGLATIQADNGYDVTVLSDSKETTYGFKLYSYRSSIRSFYMGRLIDKKSLNLLKQHIEENRYDIIHVHMVMNIDWDLYTILADKKYVVSLHDYWYLCPRIMMFHNNKACSSYDREECKKCVSYCERFRFFRGINKLIRKINGKNNNYVYIQQNITQTRYEKYKYLLENADAVLPVSNRVKKIYEQSNIAAKYHVMHIGNISADDFNLNYSYNKNEGVINAVFLGRLNIVKGARVLLEIADKIDKQKFKIHFFGDAASYAEKIKDKGIVNHGKYKQNELSTILNNMDIGFVLPIWEDNAPQVVMEMLNNHIPIIGTRMGGVPDFVNSENGYLFNPYSVDEFEEMILFLNNLSFDDIKRMKKHIIATKTTKNHIEELDMLYRSILQI